MKWTPALKSNGKSLCVWIRENADFGAPLSGLFETIDKWTVICCFRYDRYWNDTRTIKTSGFVYLSPSLTFVDRFLSVTVFIRNRDKYISVVCARHVWRSAQYTGFIRIYDTPGLRCPFTSLVYKIVPNAVGEIHEKSGERHIVYIYIYVQYILSSVR